MKCYKITLLLNLGGFEKFSETLVKAENEKSAMQLALMSECHGKFELSECKTGITDFANDFEYSVNGCVEVPENDFVILQKYLSLSN